MKQMLNYLERLVNDGSHIKFNEEIIDNMI